MALSAEERFSGMLSSGLSYKTAPRSHRSVSARKPTHATSPVLPLLPVSSIQGDPSAAIQARCGLHGAHENRSRGFSTFMQYW